MRVGAASDLAIGGATALEEAGGFFASNRPSAQSEGSAVATIFSTVPSSGVKMTAIPKLSASPIVRLRFAGIISPSPFSSLQATGFLALSIVLNMENGQKSGDNFTQSLNHATNPCQHLPFLGWIQQVKKR